MAFIIIPMSHSNNKIADSVTRSDIDDGLQAGNEGFAALDTEALFSWVFLRQEGFELRGA